MTATDWRYGNYRRMQFP